MKSVRGEGNCGEVTTRRKEACEDVRIRRVLSPGHLLAKPHQVTYRNHIRGMLGVVRGVPGNRAPISIRIVMS